MPATDNYATEIGQLRAGLASGEARVESDGDMITYRSVGDIRAAIAYFEGLAGIGQPLAPIRPASTVAVFDPS